MINLCECGTLNPLQRDGTSQAQRLLEMLKPTYFLIDERELEDLILFARKYSTYVRFYDSNNVNGVTEDWLAFIECDITTLISMVSKTNYEWEKNKYEKEKEEVFSKIRKAGSNKVNISSVENLTFRIAMIAGDINYWYENSIDEISLRKDLEITIKSSLSEALNKLIGLRYDDGSETKKLINLSKSDLDEIWEIDDKTVLTVYDTKLNKSDLSKLLNDIDAVFKEFYNSLKKINGEATKYFNEALTKYPYHQPHFALFLAFLHLFKYAQNHINTLTKSHLDFYYKEFLQLELKSAQSDTVHLIFQLAKNVNSYAIKKDTLLKAGKDDTGVEVYYGIDKEIVVNKAEVKSLQTVFLDKKEDEYFTSTKIYSAPTANSKDGNGTDFDDDDKKWKTFGETQEGKADDATTMIDADIGFAIASPIFFLNEGKREITVTFEFKSEGYSQDHLHKTLDDDSLKFYFSGKKKWIEAKLNTEITIEENKLIFPLLIEQDQPSIIKYDKAKLGGLFVTDWPVFKVMLVQKSNPYEYLKSLEIKSITLKAEVEEVTNVIVQNDVGLLDAAKPFQSFGPTPAVGSGFYIGSNEIFNKDISKLDIFIEWLDKPEDFKKYYDGYKFGFTKTQKKDAAGNPLTGQYTYSYSDNYIPEDDSEFKINAFLREDYKWNNIATDKELFPKKDEPVVGGIVLDETAQEDTGESIEPISLTASGIEREKERDEFTQFSNSLKKGFLKLELSGRDFNHLVYSKILTENVINKVKGTANTEQTILNVPYTPMVKSIKLGYTAESTFDNDIDQYFQIGPFGFIETTFESSASSSDETTDSTTTSTVTLVETKMLLPTYVFDDTEQEGLLYIGVKDLVPPQNLNLLFQVAEGSGDFSVDTPDEINWCYLVKNEWKKFEADDIVADSTNELKTTGIIEFAIPKDATKDNTLLDSNYYWIRASVENNSKAVNQLIDIKAQAVSASFRDNKNDPQYLSEALEAESISKLATRVPQIKSVTQPFASFGGKVKEQSKEYYTRVSERLRHKNRPINIWDYERIVLEYFPSIYKVKCLNHTGSESEISPGHVTVIPVSNLRNKNAINKLQPSTSINMLDEIKKYLKKSISPHVNIEVENPTYEEVKASFNVKFRKGYDEGYYAKYLNTEIIKYLSPWAFEEGEDILFGGKIHSSHIIDFIEERSYVDYLTDFKLYKYIKGVESEQNYVASAESSKSILVSYPEHEVGII